MIATECVASKAGSQLVTVAYFTGIEHPMASRKLCAVDWSAPSLVSEQTRDSPVDVLWLLEGGEPNEASARWHAAFHQRRPERYAVAIGRHGPLYRLLYTLGLRSLRYPEKFILTATFLLTVFAAIIAQIALSAALMLIV